jgi:hypothetical protein
MPLCNTPPTTGGGCVLSDEHGMTSHRCLFAIIFWKSGRDPGTYKLIGVIFDGFKTFAGDVIQVFLG